jgi:hypothetical protein
MSSGTTSSADTNNVLTSILIDFNLLYISLDHQGQAFLLTPQTIHHNTATSIQISTSLL